MKTKNELIYELENSGYSYEFVLNNLTKIQEKKLIKFLLTEKKISNDNIFNISNDTLIHTGLLIYNDKKDVIALSTLRKLKNPTINLSFFEFSYYVSKNYRLNGIKPCIVHKILYPLAYYKSHDYVLENKIKDIYGILITIDNSKLKNKHIKKACSSARPPVSGLDEYWMGTYIGNDQYSWYYPNMYY